GSALSTMYLGNNSLMVEFANSVDALKGIHKHRWAYYTNPLTGDVVDTRSTAKYHRLTTDNSKFNQVSTRNVLSADYLRLKNLEVAYTFNQKMVKKLALSKAMIFVRG